MKKAKMKERVKKPLTEAQLRQRSNAGKLNRGTKKSHYTMTEKALKQRRDAQPAASANTTGPSTPETKAISSRNAWKHGLYSQATKAMTWQNMGMLVRPCLSTCPKHPCSLVDDGKTQPGGDCLDKTVYLEAFDAIISALHSGDATHGHGMFAAQLAQAVETLQGLRAVLARDGYMVAVPMFDKEGKSIGTRYETHPVMSHYVKMLDTLGINFSEMMMTPRAVSQKKDNEEKVDAFASLMGGLMQRSGGAPVRRTFDGEIGDDDD